MVIAGRSNSRKKQMIFMHLFAATDVTPLCILHINEALCHTKSD